VSQFEYVSVAVALVYSLALARLLGGLPHTSAKNRGAPVALVWNVALILVGLTAWWILWRFNQVAWTPLRFVWFVATPGFVYLRAAILISDDPGEVTSWESHYLEVRTRFFGVGIAQAFHTALMPWLLGGLPWFTPTPAHIGSTLNLLVCLIGLSSTSRRVHLALGLTILAITVLFLFFTPSQLGAA
jgi:hypothetical protein